MKYTITTIQGFLDFIYENYSPLSDSLVNLIYEGEIKQEIIDKFDSLVNDAFTMSYKQHTYKASGIEPQPFVTSNNISGVYFTLSGNTATANQFFLTDSAKHFLRGALYFYATPNEDSLSVVNDFVKKDLQHLINTVQWK